MGTGTLKRRQKKRGGVSFQSDACQALTKVLVFRGGGVRHGLGDGRAGRNTALQQGLFQGSLHSPVPT